MVFLRILSILAIALASWSCTKKKTEQPVLPFGLAYNETLRINITEEPPSLDWAKSTDTTSALIEDNIMEGLLAYDFSTPEIGLKPALATEWKSEENAKKWIFQLRKGVQWTDGVEFVGQHVVDGWKRLLDPATASQYAYFLFNVKNARQFNQGKITDFSKVGIKVDGDTLVVELEESISYFPYLLTHHATYPHRLDIIKKYGDDWTKPQNIQSLGAFRLKEWKHDSAIVLERYENYYGEKSQIKNILAFMINENSTALNMFDSNQVDSLHTLPSTEISHLKQRNEYKEAGILGIYYYGFNVHRPPMDNVLVRKAINHAIDRTAITKMLAGGQKPISGWLPPGMYGYSKESGIEFDVEKAKDLLKKAGYADLSKFPKLTIGFNTNEDHQRIAENVQAQLKANLGLDVELENSEWKVFLGKLKADPPHIFRMGWIADYPDPENFLSLMTSYSDNNYTKWKEKSYDSLLAQALKLSKEEERKEVYLKAQEMLTEAHAPVFPIYSYVNQLLVSDRVENYPLNAMSRYIFKDVRLKKKAQ
ncbi:MAG: peptide ABC transporter substrate-binding protein [Bdellovibrionales bacterium]|nr:peptide ABC transporter substrate-binding protein [Bdellovibrionales bacterium]